MSSSMPKWKSYYYNQTIHGGISTDLAKNQTIGGSLSYSKEIDRWGGNSINEMYRNNQLFESLNSNILSHASYDQWIGNVFYDGTFSEKWKLMFNADYVSRKANDNRINQETGSMTSQHETTNDNATSHHIYAGNVKVSYHVDKNLSFSVGADASYVDEKKNYLSLDDEREQSTSRLHAEETKVAAFAGCDFSIAKFSASLGMRFETFAMLYRDAMTQDKLVDKTATSFLSIFLFINLHHHWMPYLLLSYNSDGNMREYRVRQALWCSLGVTKHFSDNAWMLRLSLNNILGTKEHEIRSVKRRQINDSMNG